MLDVPTMSRDLGLAKHASQTRLLQFASQALPTGAYAYSMGLESMLQLGLLSGTDSCQAYLLGLLEHSVVYLELPLFLRMYDGAVQGDGASVARYSRFLLACRESHEFQCQEEQMGRALARVLSDLRPREFADIVAPVTYSEGMAWATCWYEIAKDEACVLFAYNWMEQQVSALCRLLPLGPLAGQRVLDAVLERIPPCIERAKCVADHEIGAGAPMLAIASALHEEQYCRIFRS